MSNNGTDMTEISPDQLAYRLRDRLDRINTKSAEARRRSTVLHVASEASEGSAEFARAALRRALQTICDLAQESLDLVARTGGAA
jgi:hypothetical protein